MSDLFDSFIDLEQGETVDIHGFTLTVDSVQRTVASQRVFCSRGDDHYEIEVSAIDESVNIHTNR